MLAAKIVWTLFVVAAGLAINALVKRKTKDHEYTTGFWVGGIFMIGMQVIEEAMS